MKRVTLIINDDYADFITVSAMGVKTDISAGINTINIDIIAHQLTDGDTVYIPKNTTGGVKIE